MAAGTYNITLDQGSDFEISLAVSGQDLTGFTARGQIRPTPQSDILYGEFDFTISSPTSTGGTIAMSLPSFVSRNIPPGTFVYDVEVRNDSTRKAVRLIQGNITVVQGVTR